MNSSLSLRRFAALSLVGLSLSACGGGGSDGPIDPPIVQPPANQPPVVTIKAGSSETIELLTTSVGVEATDPDGDTLSYEWKQTAGASVDMGNGKEAAFSFNAPKVVNSETLAFTVSVSDGTDTVKKNIDLLVKEAETVVMLAGLAQSNALEAFRKHHVDSAPVHLDTPAPTLAAGEEIDAYDIKLSPDRQRVAWLIDPDMDGSYELKVAEIGGHGTRLLTPELDTAVNESVDELQWSPDGRSLAYVKYDDNNGDQLFVVHADSKDGLDARRVSVADPGIVDIRYFTWSPDNAQIAYFRNNVGAANYHVFFVNAASTDGSDSRNVTCSNVSFIGAWSPDSTQFAVVGNQFVDPKDKLYTIPADATDGTGCIEIVNNSTSAIQIRVMDTNALRPAYSADGQFIAFAGKPEVDTTKHDLYVIKPDGTDLRRVSGGALQPDALDDFAWSPDSKYLAFSGHFRVNNPNIQELFVVDRTTLDDANDRRRVSGELFDLGSDGDADGFVTEFEWSPDSKWLAFSAHSMIRESRADVFISDASGNGFDRRTVSGAAIDFDSDGAADSHFVNVRWSPSASYLYFTGEISADGDDELLKVPADTTDGGDRVSVSGPMATGGGHISEYDVGGPSN